MFTTTLYRCCSHTSWLEYWNHPGLCPGQLHWLVEQKRFTVFCKKKFRFVLNLILLHKESWPLTQNPGNGPSFFLTHINKTHAVYSNYLANHPDYLLETKRKIIFILSFHFHFVFQMTAFLQDSNILRTHKLLLPSIPDICHCADLCPCTI